MKEEIKYLIAVMYDEMEILDILDIDPIDLLNAFESRIEENIDKFDIEIRNRLREYDE